MKTFKKININESFPVTDEEKEIRSLHKLSYLQLEQYTSLPIVFNKYFSLFMQRQENEILSLIDELENHIEPPRSESMEEGYNFDDLTELSHLEQFNLVHEQCLKILSEPVINFYISENHKNNIKLITSGKIFFLHYLIPKIIEHFITRFLSVLDETEDKEIFIDEINNDLTHFFVLLDLVSAEAYEDEQKCYDLLDILLEKAISELIDRGNECDLLSYTIRCDIFIIKVLNLPENILNNLKQKLLILAKVASEQTDKTENIKLFISKNHVYDNFKDIQHPFYYFFKKITEKEKLDKLISAYNKAFEGKKIDRKPFSSCLLNQTKNFIFEFISLSIDHLNAQHNDDAITKFKIDIIADLVREGFYHPKLQQFQTINKKLLEKVIGNNEKNADLIHAKLMEKNNENERYFLISCANFFPALKTWACDKDPDIFKALPTPKEKEKEKTVKAIQKKLKQSSSQQKEIQPKLAQPIVYNTNEPIKKNQHHQEVQKQKAKQKEKLIEAEQKEKQSYTPKKWFKQLVDETKKHIDTSIKKTIPIISKTFFSRPIQKGLTYSQAASVSVCSAPIIPKKDKPCSDKPSSSLLFQVSMPINFSDDLKQHKKILLFLEKKIPLQDDWKLNLKDYLDNLSTPEAKFSILLYLLENDSITKLVVEAFIQEAEVDFLTDCVIYFKNISETFLSNGKALEMLHLLLLSPKLPLVNAEELKSILFFSLTDANLLYVTGQFMEKNHFPFIASILYQISSIPISRAANNRLQSSRLSQSVFTDFNAIVEEDHLLIKNILIDDGRFCRLIPLLLSTFKVNKFSGSECLQAFINYFSSITNLYQSGWTGQNSLPIFTHIFILLVKTLLDFNTLLPALIEHEILGHTFCAYFKHVLTLAYTAEIQTRKIVFADDTYLTLQKIYDSAFYEQLLHVALPVAAVLKPDAYFAAYYQLTMNTQLSIRELIAEMKLLGKYQAIVASAEFFSPDAFCSIVLEPEVKEKVSRIVNRH